MTEIDRLSVSTVDAKPVNIDWNPEVNGEYVDRLDGPSWWETFEYEDEDDVTRVLVAQVGSVVALVHEGHAYTNWSDYEEAVVGLALEKFLAEEVDEDADLPPEIIANESHWDNLFQVEPHYHGSEGPMMNYWYPLDEQDSQYSRFDPVDAAARLGLSSLVVVKVDDEYGLALAGGGMDFSWQICEAYIRLGYCPPVHFADLPAMAEEWGDAKELVFQGMKRSLTWLQDNLRYRLERLDRLKEGN